ncbi:MAG: NAD-glutamate dehydrogenase [Alphaproteobacteria bacterium]
MAARRPVAALPDKGTAAERAGEESEELAARLAAASKLIGSRDPQLAAFFQRFVQNALPEDVTRYTAPEFAALARLVFAHFSRRKPGEPVVESFVPSQEDPNFQRNETVIVCINDDMPFLYDSCIAEVTAQGMRMNAAFHPVVSLAPERRDSVIVLALHRIMNAETEHALVEALRKVFANVRSAVRDWKRMLAQLSTATEELKMHPPKISREELEESLAFLDWLGQRHFTFLGCRDYAFDSGGEGRHAPLPQTGLGLLTDPNARVIREGHDRTSLTPEVREFLTAPSPIIITKSNVRSTVHRRVHMDYVGVKRFDAQGRLTGERRFVGLFTSSAYNRVPSEIPLLRRKVDRVLKRAGLAPDSHDGKALAHIIDSYPRDELFQIEEDELRATALGILALGDRPKVRAFLRFDRFDRFVSALVFVPRERYNTSARERIHGILARAFNGRMTAAHPSLDEETLARVHFIIGRNPGPRPEADVKALEAEIRAAVRTWEDGFASAIMIATHGDADGAALLQRFRDAFPPGYRDNFAPAQAVADIQEIEAVLAGTAAGGTVAARVYGQPGDARSTLHLKLFVRGGFLPLSACLPVFENLGLKVIAEDSYELAPKAPDGTVRKAAVHNFLMERADGGPANLAKLKPLLEDAYHAVCNGVIESDGFNRLVSEAGVTWRDVTILRTVAKFLRQTNITFGQGYMEQALAQNPDIARLLVELFYVRHDPVLGESERNQRAVALHAKIEAALGDVKSLDDDRIIRRMRNVIDSTLRTNFFQRDANGAHKAYIACKLDSHGLEELPAPRPFVEVFVYAPNVEAVHLRFGKVARGGIRWSDRREDFRTEVLNLVKAQQVKNAVIVPVGAKGGFVPKQVPVNAAREDAHAEAVRAYQTFIAALLDITDNIGPDGNVVPPSDVVRHDGDDPYLVVAADKGTATFSDIANALARERGFWLGDAFASGGSQGYDHKKMGITAKGAWEAVKRHFREMGRDIQSEPFTCIGVGDMSGDVFGNGMLLSRQTKLLAAFDHRHIFLDPDPDPGVSWNERKRLFDLPRSSWSDYDPRHISKGGGVYARTLKEIPLSTEVKALTGLTKSRASPPELMRALLGASVDLLWFGGIGTFVKASAQSNADVGDRANDAIRVNGQDLKAKVVGEGANLALTQLGRVEYARRGGRINTDAVDNAAGVSTSDHEVNIKILMSGPLRRGSLSSAERDRLLVAMTADVEQLVLADIYDQTLAISVATKGGPRDLDAAGRVMRELERSGKLDRAVESLPDDETLRLLARDGLSLTRPDLAVLLAYVKLDLKHAILAGNLPDDPHFGGMLESYFPPQAVARFKNEIVSHPLRREIIATRLANKVVNLAGPLFVQRMCELASASGAEAARAFELATSAFALDELRARICSLDLKVAADTQNAMVAELAELLRRLGLWFLVHLPAGAPINTTAQAYAAGIAELHGRFEGLISPFERQVTEARITELTSSGVPLDIAEDVAVLPLMGAACEIVLLSQSRSVPVDAAAGAYFAVGTEVGLDRLRGLAERVNAADHWDRLAIRRIVDDLFASQRVLAAEALGLGGAAFAKATRVEGASAARAWAQARRADLARTEAFLSELEHAGPLSIAKLTLASSQVQTLATESP